MATVYDIITDRVVKSLEKGVAPWQKPWSGGAAGAPANLVSKREYRGVNVFMLTLSGFTSPYWLTFRQADELGGHVKKGERGTPVIFWKWLDAKEGEVGDNDGTPVKGRAPLLRYYTVFNVEQCEGIKAPSLPVIAPSAFDRIAACDAIVDSYRNKPAIRHAGAAAFYAPESDVVTMPKPESFISAEHYYSTLFHELTHSTGYKDRLNRKTLTDLCPFGSTNYSKEELVAEMGAAMLCGVAGIENRTIDNSASYLASWLRVLKGDARLVVHAAAQAQKAADLIRGVEAKTEAVAA